MNREIKFRAWRPSINAMVEPYTVSHFTLEELMAKGWPVMQYTGLKDRNGVEIYEYDIVQWNTGETFEVRWFQPHAKFLYKYIQKGYSIDNDAGSHEVEVIGNIYENPELTEAA